MKRNRLLLLAVAVALFVVPLHARVVSYAPYTDRAAYPAHQARTNRHFAIVEVAPSTFSQPNPSATFGQLVLYDSQNAEEPRVIFPPDGSNVVFTAMAMRETSGNAPVIFVQAGQPFQTTFNSFLSTDGGTTWTKVSGVATTAIAQLGTTGPDNGGPFTTYRYSQVRSGTADSPFVVATNGAVYAVANDATSRKLYEAPAGAGAIAILAGRDRDGTQFLVRTNAGLITLDLNGNTRLLTNTFLSQNSSIEGFIATDNVIYFDERSSVNLQGTLWYVKNGAKTQLFDAPWLDFSTPSVFAVPSYDYASAWIISRGGGRPTILYQATGAVLQKMWEDITSPDVEALHAGSSGNKLLIQVHRPRPASDVRIFKDPALAVWRVGEQAPRAYDELFLAEQVNKGFVHLDVETIESGAQFVFDSGAQPFFGGGGGIIVSPPPVAGGSDVVQEWGVVRASLKQELVLPSIGRTHGAFGSDWVSDVIFQNPLDMAQRVDMRFVPSGSDTSIARAFSITLDPGEIRMIKDIVGTLLQLDGTIGALFITPESGVAVTSRTYSRSGNGTYGFGMNAVDLLAAAASPRFPVTFAGAFPGSNYRTNLTITDTSGRGTEAVLMAAGVNGAMGAATASLSTPANGHEQFNFVGSALGLLPYETGALKVTPTRGSAITALFAVDNLTNDSTYFAPDISSSAVARTIPAIGHLDGANGSRFRTDLYLFNPSDQPRMIQLEAKLWDRNDPPSFLQLTLLPNEARVIRDALVTAFGKTGIARLRFAAVNSAQGVRVTSRTYSVADNGGTYGFLMPPLNNFQLGSNGDTLEILGAFADPAYRTNIGLVEVAGFSGAQSASARIEILDSSSKTIDSFTANFLIGGGTQLNDIFNARNLKITGPVLIRVTPLNGTIGAYATTTDNVTNDSSYLAANQGARQ